MAGVEAHRRREDEGLTEPAEDVYDEGPGYVSGALAAGLPLGLLGACCCSLFAVFAGAFAAKLASRRTAWFGPQEGTIAGACAGAIGWFTQVVISVPLQLIIPRVYAANPALTQGLPPIWRDALLQEPNLAVIAVINAFMLFVYVGAGAFGGGVAGHFFLRKEPRRRAAPKPAAPAEPPEPPV